MTGEVQVTGKWQKMGFYVIITSQKEPCDQICIVIRLVTMLLFPEDLNKRYQVLEKWQHFLILHMFSYTL